MDNIAIKILDKDLNDFINGFIISNFYNWGGLIEDFNITKFTNDFNVANKILNSSKE